MTTKKQNTQGRIPTSFIYGRPDSAMTDQIWQEQFVRMRAQVTPSGDVRMKKPMNPSGKLSAYYGETNYQQYCTWINDVLFVIRRGGTDYCYYAYQISDLLRFEHPCLQTHYNADGHYWSVWLAKAEGGPVYE